MPQQEDAAAQRNRRFVLIAGVVVVLSMVVAGVVIFSGGNGTTTATASPQPPATVSGAALVMGRSAGAKHRVVVYEDFACPSCREVETFSRDFLHAAALTGAVQVEYRPVHLLPGGYSSQALSAWGALLQHGTAAQALRFHDLLFDQQPSGQQPGQVTASALTSWAKKAGVTDRAALAAVGTPDAAFVSAADAAAAQAGVRVVPTVLLDGRPVHGATVGAMVDALQRAIAGG